MTKEQHKKALRAFEVDRLLKLLRIEADKNHSGHYTIFSFSTHFKCTFGTPDLDTGSGRAQVAYLPGFTTLKEAIIDALVKAKSIDEDIDEAVTAYKAESEVFLKEAFGEA